METQTCKKNLLSLFALRIRENQLLFVPTQGGGMEIFMDIASMVLVIIGALNWGSIGIFGVDAIGTLLGGQLSVPSRIVYTLVAAAGIWCITLLFRDRNALHEN